LMVPEFSHMNFHMDYKFLIISGNSKHASVS